MLVYDLEIIKAIPDKNSENLQGIEYCEGWQDHKNMGISVICAYDYVDDRYRVFCKDNFKEFQKLCTERNCLVSFNGIGFDNKVLKENGIIVPENRCYDILVQVWIGDNLKPMFEYPSHIGYGLDAICAANFDERKTGHGALAPVQWQKGEIGDVIDYCINDVKLTKDLLDYIIRYGAIKSPKEKDKIIRVRRPQ